MSSRTWPGRQKHLNRRDFLALGAGASVGAWALASCSGPPDHVQLDAPPVPDAFVPTCGLITETNIEGPFFTPNSPERTNLREPNQPGVPLRVSGRVFTSGCALLSGALLDFWQCDDAGNYDNVGFVLRGHQYTGDTAEYELTTIIPGHYPNAGTFRPAHIHVKVGAPGFGLLTTQLYFAGDPYNEGDPYIKDSLIMDLADGKNGEQIAVFDFVLAPV